MKVKLITLVILMLLLLCADGCALRATGSDHAANSGAASPQDSGATHTATTPAETSADAPEARHDPCSLVTKDEVEAVLGATVAAGVADGDDCNYDAVNQGSAGARISWLHGHADAAMQGARAGIKMMNLGQPVEGLGDEAIFMAPGVLYVRKGDDLITINLVLAPNALDKTKTLAAKALARL